VLAGDATVAGADAASEQRVDPGDVIEVAAGASSRG
jgi:hypothetical protein